MGFCGGFWAWKLESSMDRTLVRALVIPTPSMDAPRPTASSLVPLRATAPDLCSRL